jgi:hypothetical protein
MANHETHAAHDAHGEHDEEHIHMPPPSWAPVVLSLGMALLGFGTIWISNSSGLVAVIAGVLLTLMGLGRWVFEDIKMAGSH